MTYELETSPHFIRASAKFLRKHPDLRTTFERVLRTLQEDPFQSQLRLHALQGNLRGLHAISLTYQYRIVIRLNPNEQTISLISIGTHDEVYGLGD